MSALDKAREQLQQARKSNLATRAKEHAKRRMDVVVGGAAGAVIGHFEKGGKRIPKIVQVGIPAKAQWAIVLAYGSDRLTGEARERTRQAAVALAVLAGYESALAGKLVAGG